MKKLLTLFLIFILFSCVSYNPDYMESRTTGERLIDVVVISIYSGIIGASITYNLMEN